MALKIRLRQQGKKHRSVFRLVLTDVRAPRGGKYIECLGWYDPQGKTEEKTCKIETDRVGYWLAQGAELTQKAESLVANKTPEVMNDYLKKRLEKAQKVCAKRRVLRKKERGEN